jgi:hypothetical protein
MPTGIIYDGYKNYFELILKHNGLYDTDSNERFEFVYFNISKVEISDNKDFLLLSGKDFLNHQFNILIPHPSNYSVTFLFNIGNFGYGDAVFLTAWYLAQNGRVCFKPKPFAFEGKYLVIDERTTSLLDLERKARQFNDMHNSGLPF